MESISIFAKFLNIANVATFSLVGVSIAILAKSILLGLLIHLRRQIKAAYGLWLYAAIFLTCCIIVDSTWFMHMLRVVFPPLPLREAMLSNLIRISWLAYVIECLSIAFFIDNLINSNDTFHLKIHHKAYLIIAFLLSLVQLSILISRNIIPSQFFSYSVAPVTKKMIAYFIITVLTHSCYTIYQALKQNYLPKLLATQVKIFAFFAILPNIISALLFLISANAVHESVNCMATILLAYGFYFCGKRLLGLRFLNIYKHAETTYDKDFIIKFKTTLEELAQVTSLAHMRHVTDTFFNNVLEIDPENVHLFFRENAPKVILESDEPASSKHTQNDAVEKLLSDPEQQRKVQQFLLKDKILIRDELEFTNFYEKNVLLTTFTTFLRTLKADVFIPIFDHKTIIGHIIVTENARKGKLYGSVDRDKMLIFATYLEHIVNLLQHSNWEALAKEQKDLKEELYHKHQEVNQYKESIRSFIRTTRERKIGIVFYKNRKFTLANQAAQDLIKIDLNHEHRHELAQACMYVAKNVEEYKTSQSLITKDEQDNKLVVTGIPSAASNYVILTLYYPEITDTISSKLELLHDPSQWDYVLYLETTASGKLINTLIPGSSEPLINFKIQLLQAALSRKALFLDMPKDDIKPTVEIIHHISLRNKLQVLALNTKETNYESAIQLFGINPLFNTQQKEVPLLEKLDENGTLYIENIELLSLETQNSLADYLTYGYFKPIRSDRKIVSDTRIICSTNSNLAQLVTEGSFSAKLYATLSRTTLTFPPLVGLNKDELSELMDSYVEQAIATKEFKSLVTFNERERSNLLEKKPISLHEFKDHVHHLLQQKSTKKNINEIVFDASTTTDPELQRIIRLGKHALKDARMMHTLWNTFKNQTKIATLLGVNRSSVNRRCKEYNLID